MRALLAAGVRTLADVERMGEARLLAIDGVGPATVGFLQDQLVRHREVTSSPTQL